ncbi:hypothetical protein [Staphylococcus simulans]|uniref:hypothetical protein n=1 Tax=Staphylococcus simulans TaxID=1286 RepID=UPI00399B5D09
MKLKYLFAASATLALFLSGCGHSDNKSSGSKENTKQEAQHKDNKTSEKPSNNEGASEKNSGYDHSKSEKSAHTIKSFNQLTNKDKIALAMFAVGHSKYAETTVSAEELLNHSYTKLDNTDRIQKSVQIIKFQRTFDGQVPGQPSNMDVYETYESKGNYLTMMAMTDSQIIIMPEKGTNTYQQLLDYGEIYNLKDLYEKYKDNPNFSKVVNMISVSETPEVGTSSKSASSSESNTKQNSNSEGTVTRANVIDKVEEFEGHKLDTSTYTYKEPEQLEGGKWGFSFVDKSGDLAGSYIVHSDGSVEKFDSKGQPE